MVIFGSTGNTGKYFLPAALKAGWEVRAFLRTPSKVEDAANLTKMKGDLTNSKDISNAVEGMDVVVCLAGVPRGTKPGSKMDGFMTKAMQDIVAAMEKHGKHVADTTTLPLINSIFFLILHVSYCLVFLILLIYLLFQPCAGSCFKSAGLPFCRGNQKRDVSLHAAFATACSENVWARRCRCVRTR